MNIATLVKDKFSYLIQNNYKFFKKERNNEIEISFSKNTLIIEMYVDSYNENFDVIISKNAQRKNVLDFEFVNKESFIQSSKNMGLAYKVELIGDLIKNHFVEIEN